VTGRRLRRSLALADGIIDLIGVEIAAHRVRPVALTPAEWQLATAGRQALSPYEAELLALTWDTGLPWPKRAFGANSPASARLQPGRPCERSACRHTSPPDSGSGCA
jgi:hypothetical protein